MIDPDKREILILEWSYYSRIFQLLKTALKPVRIENISPKDIVVSSDITNMSFAVKEPSKRKTFPARIEKLTVIFRQLTNIKKGLIIYSVLFIFESIFQTTVNQFYFSLHLFQDFSILPLYVI